MSPGTMEDNLTGTDLTQLLERTSLCVSGPTPGVPQHDGDEGFREIITRHYTVAENNAVEQLVLLKKKLNEASTFDFWRLLMQGMTKISGAQYGFVTKRILVDDEDSAVEMPPIGEPGSCLLGVCFYYNDGHQLENFHRDYKYMAYGAPCHNMKHDKVFLIPRGLPEFVTDNPNQLPFPIEAYLGVPLFAEGKCFAHFGMMWSVEGLDRLKLGWGFIEVLLHSLEDLILQRLTEGQSFAKSADNGRPAKVIPVEAVTAAQSLKPYARSLSHELRTPMQGVVGMLDVMHATVQESLEGQSDLAVRKVFQTLRDNIEIVQDSSRRAVEAADNVVHAYDLNMQVPDTPIPPNDDDMDVQSSNSSENRQRSSLLDGNTIFFRRSKRQRTGSADWNIGPTTKHRMIQSTNSTPHRELSPHAALLKNAIEESDSLTSGMEGVIRNSKKGTSRQQSAAAVEPEFALDVTESAVVAPPGFRHTQIRDLIHMVVNESLRVGGRPDSAVAEDTDGGEIIEVRSRSSKGDASAKIIEWSVDPLVPETLYVDERDLAKLVSCVFLNAVKFTERGRVTLNAKLSRNSRFLVINVVDTGPGIPPAFIPNLFKAFSREDDSLTRQKEGLGLGLLVAKGLARKIGGDLLCVRSDISGPKRGSEFELRFPISGSDGHSRAGTSAFTSPSRISIEDPHESSARRRQTSSAQRRLNPHGKASPITPKPSDSLALAKATSPLAQSSLSRRNSISQNQPPLNRRPSTKKPTTFDRNLSKKHPLTFLVAEDNNINRSLLVNMLAKLGYTDVYEAYDGADAVRQMSINRCGRNQSPIDVILMDLWMPHMDGYQATEKILAMERERRERGILTEDDDNRARRKRGVTILAVSADVTDSALERASEVGMDGFLSKPYKLMDLEKLIIEYCSSDSA